MNRALASELARMAKADQRLRKRGANQFMRRLTPEEAMEARRIDVVNTDRLREIVTEHGWPGRSLVGEKGAEHAWLLAQHADRHLDFQRYALALLAEAVEAGDAPARHLAYLTDRVRMNEGREQVYGTQIAAVDENGGVPWPVEDAEHLDERRASLGLDPFADYARNWAGMKSD